MPQPNDTALNSGDPLELVQVSPSPSNLPTRLYQLFIRRGGGAVVFLRESSKRLSKLGWTVQRVEVNADEADALAQAAGVNVQAGQAVFFVSCDGVSIDNLDGTYTCDAPGGLLRTRMEPKSLSAEVVASRFVPAGLVESYLAFSAAPDKGGVAPQTRLDASLSLRMYREIFNFYRVYVNCVSAFAEQGRPDLAERNLARQVRDVLVRLEQPVGVVGLKLGSARMPLLTGEADFFAGSALIAADRASAERLLSMLGGELIAASQAVEALRRMACLRVGALRRQGLIKSQDQERAASCLSAMGCETSFWTPLRTGLAAGAVVALGAFGYTYLRD